MLPSALAQDSLCAEVKIEIKQKVSLERQAFDAVMKINNGLDGSTLTGIAVNLTFQDANGQPVIATTDASNTTASFFLRLDSLDGVGAIDGSGAVAPKTSGIIKWLIIPAAGAGGLAPSGQTYKIGGTLTYTLEGETKTVIVSPETIVVKPQPQLILDYFIAGDVYADDPFTPETEPPVPFTLGVRVKNVGGGPANKLKIETAQPKIIDNKQGLAIAFQIINGYVNDVPSDKTLLLNFGDIPSASAKVGRWDMITTLSGRFTELSATFTHDDNLGGALTSLLKGVNTYLLIHDVKVDLPGRDNVRDFLALDGDTPKVFESDGQNTAVTDYSAGATLTSAAAGNYRLRFNAAPGLAYVKLSDPNGGTIQPGVITRSDGKVLPPENIWLSKKRNPDLTWAYSVNFFDANSTGDYTVQLLPSGQLASIAGSVFVDLNNNGIRDAGELPLGVVRIDLAGKDAANNNVTTSATTDMNGAFTFTQLKPGTYSLTVAATNGYIDGIATAGSTGGTVLANVVSNILLSAGVTATGYNFAKRRAPPNQADLAASLTVSTPTAIAGANITLTAKVKNTGPATSIAATGTLMLPTGMSFISATASAGTFNSTTGQWTIGDIAKDAEPTLSIVAKVDTYKAYTVILSAASVTLDPVPSNNTASATLNAVALQQSDIRVLVTPSALVSSTNTLVNYLVEVTNLGPDEAAQSAVGINLPSNLAVISVVKSAGTYTNGAWTIDTLPANTTASLIFIGNLLDANPAAVTATLNTIASTDPVAANNASTGTINGAAPQADLAIALSADKTVLAATENAQLTIKVSNMGPADASQASVQLLLPTDLVLTNPATLTGTFDSVSRIWTIGTLAMGSSATLTAAAQSTAGATSVVTVRALAASSDPAPANNESQIAFNGALAGTDLSVSQLATPVRIVSGQPVTIRTTVSNLGTNAAANTVVVGGLPASVTLVSSAASLGSYDNTTGLWTLPSLNSGASATLDLVVNSNAGFSRSVAVTADTADLNTANNQSRLNVTATAADLAASITASNTNPVVGQPVTLTARLQNLGPDTAQTIVAKLALPAGLTIVSAAPNSGTFDIATNRWTIASMANAIDATLVIVVNVASAPSAPITFAIESSATVDPVSANNNATLTLNSTLQADLTATISGPSVVNPTDILTYQIGAVNVGPSPATGATLHIELPATLANLQLSCSVISGNAVCPPTLGTAATQDLVLATFAANSEIKIVATGTAPVIGPLSARAVINAPAGVTDPVTTNNTTADVVTQVRVAIITSTIAADKVIYSPADTVAVSSTVASAANSLAITAAAVNLQILDSANATVFTDSRTIASLAAGASTNLTFAWAINEASPGLYRIEQQVVSSGGATLATAFTTVTVDSTANTGTGVTGTIIATPNNPVAGASTTVSAILTNLGNADLTSVPVSIVIRDATQALITQFASTVNISRASPTTLSQVWAVPSALTPGTYTVTLTGQFGATAFNLAQTSVIVRPLPILIASTVVLDKASYAASDTVAITATITNDVVSSPAANLTVSIVITDASNAPLFTAQSAIAALATGSSATAMFNWPINNAPPGIYTVTQTVRDIANVVLDTRTLTFAVQSSANTGAGVSGTVAATPVQVLQGATTNVTVQIVNTSNADLTGIPLRIMVRDASSVVVQQWDSVQLLSRAGPNIITQPWSVTALQAAGTYAVSATATFGSTVVQLGQTSVIVKLRPVVVTSTIATNKASFTGVESATLLVHIASDATSADTANLSVSIKVTNSAGAVVFTDSQAIATLIAGTSADRTSIWAIGNASPGLYTVTARILDNSNAVLDTKSTTLTVQSTADNGVGVTAMIAAMPVQVLQGASTSIVTNLTNAGNVDLAALPVGITIRDANQAVVQQWDTMQSLLRANPTTITQIWAVPALQAVGTYTLSATATFGSTVVPLGQSNVVVKLRPVIVIGTVTANKASYAATETVTLASHITSDAQSAAATNLSIAIKVVNPAGTQVYTASQMVPSLAIADSVDRSFMWPIANATPGIYTVTQQVLDSANAVLDTKTMTLTVQSTSENGVGVGATIVASPADATPGNSVTFNATVTNAGNADATMVATKITVTNAANLVVQQWSSTQTFSRASPTTITQVWAVPATQALGTYTVTLTSVFSGATPAAPVTIQLAQASVNVKAVPTSLTSSVTLDKMSYVPSNTVAISTRVTNGAISSPVINAIVKQKITSPGNTVVFSSQQTIATLAVGASVDQSYSWPISNAAPGTYTLTQQVLDAANSLLDTRSATFIVQSTADTGYGVTASVLANPLEVVQGDTALLSATFTNAGNIDVANVPTKITVLSAANVVITSFSSTTNLNRAAPTTSAQSWLVPAMQSIGDYKVTVDVTLGGVLIKLAEANFKVKVRNTFNVAASSAISANTRLLVLVSCQAANQTSTGYNYDEPFCLTQRQNFIKQYLTDLGMTHFAVTTSYDEFRNLLRCGDYNTYWISGGADKLKDNAAQEVREAVLRGDALLIDGSRDLRSAVFDEVTGITYLSKLTGVAASATLAGASGGIVNLGNGVIPAAADLAKITAASGTQVQARFANNDPAIVTDTYGNGKSAYFAYDLMATLQAAPTDQVLKDLLSNTLALVKPPLPADMWPRSGLAPVIITLQNNGTAADVQLEVNLPTGSVAADILPAVTTSTASKITWRVSLAAGQTKTYTLNLRLPSSTGATTTLVKLFRVDGTVLTETYANAIAVITEGGDLIRSPLVADLNALALTGAPKTARDTAVQLINSGYTKAGQSKFSDAIADYLAADTELDKITVPDTTAYQVRVARLMQDTGKLSCAALSNSCPATAWGPVDYNVLIFGSSSTSNSDTQGAMAIGGALSMSSYSVASKLTADSARLYVAGSVAFSNGSVGSGSTGVIRVGGSAAINQSVSRRLLQTGVPTESFTSLKTWYLQLSDKVALLAGVPAVTDGYGKYTFTGTDPVRNVFTIPGASIASARQIVFNVPDTATVIVNITGTAASFTNGQNVWGTQSMSDHPRSGQILYNFPQATGITISSFSPAGTFLAPRASLAHSNATLNGQAIVNSFAGSGGFHCGGSFQGTLPAAVAPVQ